MFPSHDQVGSVGILAQRNGSNPQEFRIYHSGTSGPNDPTDYERLSIKATGYNYEISPQVNGGTAGSVIITNDTSTAQTLIVRGAASQSANLQEWQDSAGNTYARVTSNGRFSNPTADNTEVFGDAAVGFTSGVNNIIVTDSGSVYNASTVNNRLTVVGSQATFNGSTDDFILVGSTASIGAGTNTGIVLGNSAKGYTSGQYVDTLSVHRQ